MKSAHKYQAARNYVYLSPGHVLLAVIALPDFGWRAVHNVTFTIKSSLSSSLSAAGKVRSAAALAMLYSIPPRSSRRLRSSAGGGTRLTFLAAAD
jgi:hypothetical protein